jgi:dCMP deaminase
MEPHMRPSWDDYFLSLVDQVAARATCDRGKSGSVVVRDKRIICTGYVGSPAGMAHCDDVGHDLKRVLDDDGTVRQHCVRTVHAEQNAIVQAARYGLPLDGTTIYCSMEPCRVCAMLIASTGITRVVARRRYHAGGDTPEILAAARIEFVVVEEVVQEYEGD